MLTRQVQIDRRVGQLGVFEQHLDGAEIGARFEQVRRLAVPERVRRDSPGDAGRLRRLGHGDPRDLRGDRHVGPSVVLQAPIQVGLRLHPAPVLAQGGQQPGAEWNVAVASTLAFADV